MTPAGHLARDLRWAEAAAAGDRGVYEQIYQSNQNRIYGLCLRLAGDVVEAEQLTQDTFVKAWFAIGGYRGRGTLGGWLARVAANLWRDRYRGRLRRLRLAGEAAAVAGHPAGTEPTASLTGTAHTGGDGIIPLLTAIDLERCLRRLPEGGRLVFVLHDIEGYTHREIATLLAIAVGTSKAQLHRVRRLLREMLIDRSETDEREKTHGA